MSEVLLCMQRLVYIHRVMLTLSEQQLALVATELEEHANSHVAHERFVFEQGYNRAFQDMEATLRDEIEKTKNTAVVFLSSVRRALPDFLGFEQLRVGRNSMLEPTVFAVLPGNALDRLETIRDTARMIEEVAWDHLGLSLSVWTVVDGHLDQSSIDHDFPWIYSEA